MNIVYLDIAKIAFDSHPEQEIPKKRKHVFFVKALHLNWLSDLILGLIYAEYKNVSSKVRLSINLWSYNSFLMQDLASEKFVAWNMGWGSQAGIGSE